jgi:Tfp pilus assembly protein PilV
MDALRKDESGFGIVELVIAMLLLSVGILALASAFTSGSVALRRASRTATATAIADAQLERYRAIRYCAVYLEPATVPAGGSNYWTGFVGPLVTTRGASCPDVVPTESVTARRDLLPGQTPDGHRYRVDTYIVEGAPTATPAALSQSVKTVTVVVRDWNYLSRQLVRQTSTFHRATGT